MPDTSTGVVSYGLRHSEDGFMRRRRGVVALSVFSCTVLGAVALFQVGILEHLPDPPLPGFDADAVNGSADAYRLLHTPDALLGMTSYAVTACLAGMGGADRSTTARWIPLSMGVKTAVDVAQAARLSRKQAIKFHKYSVWSLLVAGATVAAFSLALPEFCRAITQTARSSVA